MGPLGILMLETRFPRLLGDVGHPDTWPFPVRFATVAAATPDRVVQREPAAGLLEPFVAAARGLVDEGAVAITTSCGFLSLFQAELAAAVPVPVATSSLAQVLWVQALLPDRQVGVITIDAGRLTPAHLTAAGAPAGTPVVGTEGGRELGSGLN